MHRDANQVMEGNAVDDKKLHVDTVFEDPKMNQNQSNIATRNRTSNDSKISFLSQCASNASLASFPIQKEAVLDFSLLSTKLRGSKMLTLRTSPT